MRFVGGYEDWERQRAPAEEPEKQKSEQKATAAKSAPRKAAPPQRIRMSFKETRELAELPDKIESLEAESEALLAAMSSPDYHKRSIEEQKADKERSAQLPSLIESLYRRWEELSEKQSLAEAL